MRYISCFQRASEGLIRLRNGSKLVDGSLFAITDLLLGAKTIFVLYMACGEMIFAKKFSN